MVTVRVTVESNERTYRREIARKEGASWPRFAADIFVALSAAHEATHEEIEAKRDQPPLSEAEYEQAHLHPQSASARRGPEVVGAAEQKKSLMDGFLRNVTCAYCRMEAEWKYCPTLRQFILEGWTCPHCGEYHAPAEAEILALLGRVRVECPDYYPAYPDRGNSDPVPPLTSSGC